MDPTGKLGFYLGQFTGRWESACVFIQYTVQPGGMSETVLAFYSHWLPPVRKENEKKNQKTEKTLFFKSSTQQKKVPM